MRISIRAKLIGAFVMVVVVAGGGIGVWSALQARRALENTVFDQLTSVRAIKANQIEEFFVQRRADIRVYAENTAVRSAFEQFVTAFRTEGGHGGPQWSETEEQYQDRFEQYVEVYGYRDLFFVDADGNVVYTISQEADLGANTQQGALVGSGLARAAEGGLTTETVVDFSWYEISEEPAAFLAYPIQGLDDGSISGTLVYQFSLAAINQVMQERTGLGTSGETYLIGPDRLMRSDSFLAPDTHTVVASFSDPTVGSVDTVAAADALAGGSGTQIIDDYRGEPVLSSWAPVQIEGLDWALIAEIDRSEAMAPVRRLTVVIAVMSAVVLLVSVVIGYLIARAFSVPAQAALQFSQTIAQGDLTRTLTRTTNDEFGEMIDALGAMRDQLSRIVQTVKQRVEQLNDVGNELSANMVETSAASEQIGANVRSIETQVHNQDEAVSVAASAVEQINRSIEALDHAIDRQATAVTESSASIEEMIANVQSISTNMHSVAGDVQELRGASDRGNDAVTSMGKNAGHIADQSATLGDLNRLISDISARTNLLAMNAAIEAAHAGDAGRGFAVVAAEIRSLAETSASQSQKVDAQLKLIQTTIDNVVADSQATEKAFAVVFERVERVQRVIEEINSAVSEQSAGGSEVLEALKQITDITTEVQSGSGEMKTGGTQILSAVQHLENISSTVGGGVREIANGIKEINQSMANVQSLTHSNKEYIGGIIDAVSVFTLAESDGTPSVEVDSGQKDSGDN